MHKYGSFAWEDARNLLELLLEFGDIEASHELFNALTREQHLNQFMEWREPIAEYIGKTDSQRLAMIKRVRKTLRDADIHLFLIYVFIGTLEIAEAIDIRDAYQWTLQPGGTYRQTNMGMHSYLFRMRAIPFLRWPQQYLESQGIVEEEELSDDENDELPL